MLQAVLHPQKKPCPIFINPPRKFRTKPWVRSGAILEEGLSPIKCIDVSLYQMRTLRFMEPNATREADYAQPLNDILASLQAEAELTTLAVR